MRVIVRPSVLPRLGPVCIQLLESPDSLSDAAAAIRREILGQYPVERFLLTFPGFPASAAADSHLSDDPAVTEAVNAGRDRRL